MLFYDPPPQCSASPLYNGNTIILNTRISSAFEMLRYALRGVGGLMYCLSRTKSHFIANIKRYSFWVVSKYLIITNGCTQDVKCFTFKWDYYKFALYLVSSVLFFFPSHREQFNCHSPPSPDIFKYHNIY